MDFPQQKSENGVNHHFHRYLWSRDSAELPAHHIRKQSLPPPNTEANQSGLEKPSFQEKTRFLRTISLHERLQILS